MEGWNVTQIVCCETVGGTERQDCCWGGGGGEESGKQQPERWSFEHGGIDEVSAVVLEKIEDKYKLHSWLEYFII